MKAIISRKSLIYLMPLMLAILLRIVFRLIDRYFIDGNGIIDHPIMEYGIYTVDIIAILTLVYALLREVFRFTSLQIILNLAIVFVMLYLLEWKLYKADPFYKMPFDSGYYDYKKFIYKKKMPLNFDYKEPYITWGNVVRKNRYGFRERDFATPKPDSVFRIMVLGDSYTWGSGLAENERYSNLLELMLKNHFKQVEVLNFGYSGSPTVAERDTLVKYKDLVQPDLIIVGFCVNDPQPKSQDYVEEKELFISRYGHIINQIKQHLGFLRLCYVADTLEHFFYRILEKTGIIPKWQVGLNRTYDVNSTEWKNFVQALKDIKTTSDSLGCPPPIFAPFNSATSLPVMLLPEYEEEDRKLELSWLHQARITADSLGFLTIDLGPAFSRAISAGRLHMNNLVVSPLDGHPSAEMNKIYAEELYEVVLPIVKQHFNKQ